MSDKSEIEAIRAVRRYKAKWSDIGMSSSDDVTLIEARDYDALEARVAHLKQMLRNAREKLGLYRQAHSGEYIGGVEYVTLIRSIDAALAEVKP